MVQATTARPAAAQPLAAAPEPPRLPHPPPPAAHPRRPIVNPISASTRMRTRTIDVVSCNANSTAPQIKSMLSHATVTA
ncbi:hypothetical protein TcWFU_001439 [Taenia crassiceps]|uniref:Uncharacterized protein n=1 Tax=Taenia crassiceps TaxID=6207 RepID=A0ABR4QAI7_9CEST